MDLTHLGSLLPVYVHGCWLLFVGSHLCLQAVVFVHGQGSCPGCSSFVHGSCRRPCCLLWSWLLSLEPGLSFVGNTSSFIGGGAHLQEVYVAHGWGADVRAELSYMHGVAFMGHW